MKCKCSYQRKTLSLNTWPGAFIEDIKGEVGDTFGMDPSDVRLMFNDEPLEQDHLRLSDIGINENTVLSLIGRSSLWQPVVSTVVPYGGQFHLDPTSDTLQPTLTTIDLSTRIETDQNQIHVVSDVPSVDQGPVPVTCISCCFMLGLLIDTDIIFARCPWTCQEKPSVRDCMEDPQHWFFQPAASLTRLVMSCKRMTTHCDVVNGHLAQHVITVRSVVNLYNDYIWDTAVRKKHGLPLLLAGDLALDRAARSWIGSRLLFSLDIGTEEMSLLDDEGDVTQAAVR